MIQAGAANPQPGPVQAPSPRRPPAAIGRIAGVVLAGGRSRRFGRDKASVLLGGRPLILWSIDTLRLASDLLAVGGPDALGKEIGLPSINDYPDAKGPLAGILGALLWAASERCSHVLTAPCDTPFLPNSLGERLMQDIGDHPVAVARAARVHALCGLWRVDLVDRLAPIAAEPAHAALERIVEQIGGVFVDFADEQAFANLNTPAEFAEAVARLA